MPPTSRQNVVITDIDMSIGSMCRFMVKWAIAAIPAAIILSIFVFLASVVVIAVLGGLGAGIFNHHY